MPSDPRLHQAREALARPIAAFRTIVEAAMEQGQAFLSAQHETEAKRVERASASLGAFAAGRVRAAPFAELFPAVGPASPAAVSAMMRAMMALRAVREEGDAAFEVEVQPGQRLGQVIEEALGRSGRAFGAVVLAELVRGGRYLPEHDRLLEAHAFRTWNRTERRFAPPLAVLVDGGDLQSGAIADFADGGEKIVLVVRAPAPPAPLARCITPGTFVLQTVDGSGLDRVAGFEGPAVAAIMPEGGAVFMHDPAAGREPWQRMTVRHLPAEPKHAIGGLSAWQMAEDLRLVAGLASTPFSVPAAQGTASPALGVADATDRIAAWLLAESGAQGGAP